MPAAHDLQAAPQAREPASPHAQAEALREQLRRLCHLMGQFEHYRDEQGHELPPSHANALVALLDFAQHDANPTLTDLVELLNIDKSNVTRLCQRMQECGHVEVKRDERDRRAKRVQLSARGLVLAHQINAASVARFSSVLGALDDARREQAQQLLSALNAALARSAR